MRSLRAAAAVFLLLLPQPVWAHAAIPGISGAYFAFWHTLTEMPAPLALAGLGLLIGLHGAEALKWAWPSFFVMMITGLVLTLGFRVFTDPELPLLLLALVTSAYAACGLPLAPVAATGLGALCGYFLGVFIAPSPASWSTQAYVIAGGLIAANFALVFIVAAAEMIRTHWPMPWITIGLRVLASWIAAIAALMAALAAR